MLFIIGSIFLKTNSFIIKSRVSTSSRLLTRMTDINPNSSPIQSNERPMKTFLLTAGEKYYPSRADGDWQACFATKEEAEEFVNQFPHKAEWYEIIDLKDWIYEDEEQRPERKVRLMIEE